MKTKITLLFLAFSVGVFSQVINKEEATDRKKEERAKKEVDFYDAYLKNRNEVGVRKLLAWTFAFDDNDSKFSNFQINDFGIYYSRLLGRRWHLGAGYYQSSEHFAIAQGFYQDHNVLYADVSGLLSASRNSQHLRFSFGFDIIQKRFLIVRATALLSLFLWRTQYPGALPDAKFGKGSIDLSKPLYFYETTSSYNEFQLLVMGLDFLYPIKFRGGIHEVGISTHVAPGNNPKLGVSGVFNFRF